VARRIVVGKMLIGRPLSSMRSRLEAYDASRRAPALLRKRYSPNVRVGAFSELPLFPCSRKFAQGFVINTAIE
jgi:hypothetical protein